MKLVVVESPGKAKTINKYLGRDYEVVASFGHIRDLPPKDGSVDPEHDFAMKWEIEGRGAKQVAEIARAMKGAEKLILATDPDREGEAISWHVVEALREKRALKDTPIERVTFNAITKRAVDEAMAAPRQIDQALVDAYMARRALDYLVGFNLSPVLWRKLPGARSAGRVQSVALRLVCDREQEIETFVKREYWSLIATLATTGGAVFEARLVGADGKRITRLDIGTEKEARAFEKDLGVATCTVATVEAKPQKRHPYPPFTTSTLQQEASRKLGLAPARTMQIAQRLYEGIDIGGETVGLITYMRTDGVDMAPEAVAATRGVIGQDYGKEYLPAAPRKYTVKAKNAQEAHEAIRPTDPGRRPDQLRRALEPEMLRLYELIWNRTIASQMESAEFMRTTVDIDAKVGPRKLTLRATGQVTVFDGFLAVYQEGREDEDEDEENRKLPPLKTGDPLACRKIAATQHFTEPPPRYSESSLVKRMEELGIGRPSTYASILAVLKEREYVRLDKKKLIPEDKGRLVTAFLMSFFPRYVEYDFTADLEEQLDKVSAADLDWKELLRRFWKDFSGNVGEAKERKIGEVITALDQQLAPHIFPAKADGSDPRQCPSCGTGGLSLRLGKFGAFIGCSNYPECKFTRQLAKAGGDGEAGMNGGDAQGVRKLGVDPVSGLEVSARDGRFGPYVQLGEGEKPKRQNLPRGLAPDMVDLEKALALLSLPREVAKHPESGEPILAGIGRYGPYVQHGKTYANVGSEDDVLEIGANRAIDLIVRKEQGGGFRRGGDVPGKVLGRVDGIEGDIVLKPGRYGPYVTNGEVNATLPKGMPGEELTLEAAAQLIRARMASGVTPKRGAKGRGKAAAKSNGAAKAKATAAKAAPETKAAAKAPAKGKTATKSKPATKSKAAAKSKTAAKSKPAPRARSTEA